MWGPRLLSTALAVSYLCTYSIATTNPPAENSNALHEVQHWNQNSAEQSLHVKVKKTKSSEKLFKEDIVNKSNHPNSVSVGLRIPPILDCIFSNMGCKDLRNAATACKEWSQIATTMHKRFHRADIIHLDHALNHGICSGILRSYKKRVENGSDKKPVEWQPKLMVIFPSCKFYRYHRHCLTKHLEIVQKNCRTFCGSHYDPPAHDFQQEKHPEALFNGRFTGFIFPQALLAQPGVNVDVIFPTLKHLSNALKLFNGKPEENKKMFQHLYGWNNEDPIKAAIVMSRRIPGEPVEVCGAYRRAKEVTRWLKSFPESGNMPICITLDADKSDQPDYNEKIDASLAVILFGGFAVHVSAYMRGRGSFLPWKNDQDFVNWMAVDLNREMPKVSQDISFLIGRHHYAYTCDSHHCTLPRTTTLSHHRRICGLEREETDIAMLDESVQQVYDHCFLKIGFK